MVHFFATKSRTPSTIFATPSCISCTPVLHMNAGVVTILLLSSILISCNNAIKERYDENGNLV